MKASLIILLLSIVVPALGAAEYQSQKVPQAVQTNSNELRVGVKVMVCAFCAQGIEKKFKAQKEVENVQVSLENKFVLLKFKEGQRLSNEKIVEVLKDAGYEANFGGQSDKN